MKKVLVLLSMIATLLLVACTETVQTNARAVVSAINPTTSSVSFKIEVRDPDTELDTREVRITVANDDFSKEVTETINKNVTKTVTVDGLARSTEYIITVVGTKNGADLQLYKSATAFKTLAQGDEESDPITIVSVDQFKNMNAKKHYKLGADLDFNNASLSPLFTSGTPFNGTFDGNGHTIKNIQLTESNDVYKSYLSIFGYASKSKIMNVNFDNITIDNDARPYTGIHYVGIVVSKVSNNDFVLDNVTISNSEITLRHNINQSALNRNLYVGLVGGSLQGKLSNITVVDSSLNVTQNGVNGVYSGTDMSTAGSYVGGIAGLIEQDKGVSTSKLAVVDTAINVNVNQDKKSLGSGLLYVGGIFGANRSDKNLSELVSNAVITIDYKKHADTEAEKLDKIYVGGIMGSLLKAQISNVYYYGSIDVTLDAKIAEIQSALIVANTTRSASLVVAQGSIQITAPESFLNTIDVYNYLSFGAWNKAANVKLNGATSVKFNDVAVDLAQYEVIADASSFLTSDFVKAYIA